MRIKRQISRRSPKGLLILATLPVCESAFVGTFSPVMTAVRKKSMPMVADSSALDLISNVKDSLDLSYTTAYSLCSGASSIFCLNENVEAEIFGDMSHITLDLATFLSPDTASLRLLLFLGRIFSIASDYIPDHKMSADEGIFQLVMLAYSSRQLIKSVLLPFVPLVHQSYENGDPILAFRHRRAYLKTFYCAGFTYSQYQVLIASGALRWISLSPHTNMTLWQKDESDFMYLLHRGPVYHIMIHDEVNGYPVDLYEASPATKINLIFDYMSACRLIDGDSRSEKRVFHRTSRSSLGNQNKPSSPKQLASFGLLKAGDNGAMLLQMNIQRVLEIMKDDDDISKCMKRLIFLGLQEKLSTTSASN